MFVRMLTKNDVPLISKDVIPDGIVDFTTIKQTLETVARVLSIATNTGVKVSILMLTEHEYLYSFGIPSCPLQFCGTV